MKSVDILEKLSNPARARSGVISVPARYIHSLASLLSIKDVENAVKLVVAAVENVSKYF